MDIFAARLERVNNDDRRTLLLPWETCDQIAQIMPDPQPIPAEVPGTPVEPIPPMPVAPNPELPPPIRA